MWRRPHEELRLNAVSDKLSTRSLIGAEVAVHLAGLLAAVCLSVGGRPSSKLSILTGRRGFGAHKLYSNSQSVGGEWIQHQSDGSGGRTEAASRASVLPHSRPSTL